MPVAADSKVIFSHLLDTHIEATLGEDRKLVRVEQVKIDFVLAFFRYGPQNNLAMFELSPELCRWRPDEKGHQRK